MNYLPFNLEAFNLEAAISTKKNGSLGGNRKTNWNGTDNKSFKQMLVSQLDQTSNQKKVSLSDKQKAAFNSSAKKPESVREQKAKMTTDNVSPKTPEPPTPDGKHDTSLKTWKTLVNSHNQATKEKDQKDPEIRADIPRDLLLLGALIAQISGHNQMDNQNAEIIGYKDQEGTSLLDQEWASLINQVKPVEQLLKENSAWQQLLKQLDINLEGFSPDQLKQVLSENNPKWQLLQPAGIKPVEFALRPAVDLSQVSAIEENSGVFINKQVLSSNLRLIQSLESNQVAGSNLTNNPEDIPAEPLALTKNGLVHLLQREEGHPQSNQSNSAAETPSPEGLLSKIIKEVFLEPNSSLDEGVAGLPEDELAYLQPSPTKADLIDSKTTALTRSQDTIRPQQLFQQLVQQARVMVKEGLSELQIQLKPEFLGRLNLHLAVENGLITARFMAENLQVKQIIESNLNQLKQSLGEQGLQIDRLEVSVGGGSTNQHFSQHQAYYLPNQNESNYRQSNRGAYLESAGDEIKEYVDEMSTHWDTWLNEGINYLA
ncbi:MAG: flagellar hook-length control protein FliK [Syntrophomonadaceae bacterium]|nr:flagellar hook-length control protein FliK [Syntrophomonadaceae bacterium]